MRSSDHSPLTLHQLVEQIINSGQLSRREHLNLRSMLLSDRKISHEERLQINRVFDSLQAGRLKLVE